MMAAAIQYAARRILDLKLSDEQAYRLAEIGKLEDVIDRLERRGRVRIVAGSATFDSEFQKALVVEEVVADARGLFGSAKEKEAFRELLIAQRKKQIDREGNIERETARLGGLTERLRNRGWMERRFLRRADRLRRRQLTQLRARLHDRGGLRIAEERLDNVHAKYLRSLISATPVR